MPRLLLVLCVSALASGGAVAQGPSVWKDPEEGCWYVISPQGGVAIRYRRDGTPDCPDAGVSAATPGLRAPSAIPAAAPSAASPRPTPPDRPDLSGVPIRAAIRTFTCVSAEPSAGPAVQRFSIDQGAMILLVEAAGGARARTERYTIDSNMDAWLGGRNQRDPRLGFVLTQSRGLLRLDWPEGGSLRAPIRSYSFRCQAVGTLT